MALTLKYEPRSAFLPFHNRKARFATLVCHRRAGKTVALVNDLIIGALECPLPRPQMAYIAPSYGQAKRIAWEYLKHYAEPLLAATPHESELRVTLKNEAKIYLLGAEKANNLRGMYLDGAVMDEYAQTRPTVVSQIILPSLSDRSGWLVKSGTPVGKNHFYDDFNKAKADPAQFHMLLKASQSGILGKEELALIKSMMDASDYEQEYECSFEAALRGAIYGADMERVEAENRAGTYDLDPALPVDVVCDLGYTDDTVLIFFQRNKHQQVLIHEILSSNEQEWPDYLDEMDLREVRDVYLPHDARAKNLQTGRSIVEQTLLRGYHPKIVPDHKLRDGVNAVHRMLPFTYWNHPLTSGGIEAMKSYRRMWDEKTSCYRDRPVHDWTSHVADAVRYLAVILGIMPTEQSLIILPNQERTAGANYAFSLENLFTDYRTNPALRARDN